MTLRTKSTGEPEQRALPPPREAANLRGMKLPRKGILIRLGIYLPIIGYLAWQAFFAREEPQPQPAPKKEFQIIEVTPEEAKAMGVDLEFPRDPPEPSPEAGATPKTPQ